MQEIKRREHAKSIAEWKRRWEASTKGKWTSRLISSLSGWVSKEHGVIIYELTQFHSGHGGYREYLYLMTHLFVPVAVIQEKQWNIFSFIAGDSDVR